MKISLKRVLAFLAAAFAFHSGQGYAQEAPDVLIKRVSEEVLAIAKTACLQGYTGSCNLRLLCENRIFCASVGSVRVRARM